MIHLKFFSRLVLLVQILFLTGWVYAQSPQPIYRATFNESQFSQTGWNSMPSGSGEFQPASISLGQIPSTNVSDGRGILLTAANGQGSLLYGPPIYTGDYPVLLRLSVYALSEGGSLAMGALDIPPNGTIANADGSVTYALEQDTKRYTGSFSRITVIYSPKRKAVIPLFQLAVVNSGPSRTVTVMFDNFELYSLGPDTIKDPTLLDLLAIVPATQPTPTPTPTQPPISEGISVSNFVTLSPTNDIFEGFTPRVAFDKADQFTIAAEDHTLGYQDILLRELFATDGKVLGPYTVNETFQNTNAIMPDIAVGSDGIRHIIWSDNRTTKKLFWVYLAEFNSAGQKMNAADFLVNIPYEGTNATSPRLVIRSDGNLLTGWTDDRNLYMDYFIRRLKWSNGQLLASDSTDIQINNPFQNTQVTHPAIAVDANGNVVAVWSDNRLILSGNKRKDIYGRFFRMDTPATNTGSFAATYPEIQLSAQDTVYDLASDPEIVELNGRFVVVWRNTDPVANISSIHGCVVTANGSILVPEFVVDYGDKLSKSAAPSLAVLGPSIILITWLDEGEQQIYERIYNPADNVFITNPEPVAQGIVNLGITSTAAGLYNQFVVVWDSSAGNYKDLFGIIGKYIPPLIGKVQTPKAYKPSANRTMSEVKISQETARTTGTNDKPIIKVENSEKR